MGNCCSSGAADGGYPLKPLGGEKNEVTQGQPIRTAGMAANSDQDRAKRLAAAEERQKKAEQRGVQQGGGQLAKKLQNQSTTGGVGQGELPTNNLDWRVD